MKRYRMKAAGIGMALWVGSLHGADAPRPPAILPATMRADWTPSPTPSDTLWLPARSPAPASVPTSTVTVVPAIAPDRVPTHVNPASIAEAVEAPVGPRRAATSMLDVGSIPEIPVPSPGPFPISPTLAPLPELPAIPSAIPSVQPKDPLPAPRTVPPAIPPAKDIPDPVRPVERELPTAPPELMVPAGTPVPGKHGTFGSQTIRISQDYPSVRELLDHDGSWWGSRDSGDAATAATDRLELHAEFLLWWMNSQNIPVLATTSANGGFGFLGDSGTRTLLGPGGFGDTLRTGLRLRAGYWFDDCGSCGLDGSFFFLGKRTTAQSFDSGATPTITRPIFAPNFPGEFGEVVAMPGLSTGTLTVESTSSLHGFDANVRKALCKTCDYRSEIFAGYRFLGLNESLSVSESITALPANANDPEGTRIAVRDQFQTRNRFNGGQVGYAAERIWSRVSLEGRASVALGNTSQTLDISGSQTRLRPGMAAPDTFTGGLLATGPNLGHFTRDRFSVVPELTLNAGFWVTPVLKAYVGYNFIYWSNVLRPGDQIDRTVDVTFVPNPPPGVPFSGQNRPQPTFQQSHLYVNGIQFGLMGRW